MGSGRWWLVVVGGGKLRGKTEEEAGGRKGIGWRAVSIQEIGGVWVLIDCGCVNKRADNNSLSDKGGISICGG